MGFSMGIVQMFYKLTYFPLFAVHMMRLFVGSEAMEPPYFTASRYTRRKAAIFNAFPSFAAGKARRARLPQNYLSFVTFRPRNFFPADASQLKKSAINARRFVFTVFLRRSRLEGMKRL